MDESVVLAKLDSLKRCIERVRSKTPESIDVLIDDVDRQDIIAVNLERAVQLCVDIAAHILSEQDVPAPEAMADSFDVLAGLEYIPDDLAARLRKAVGFRNIAVHAYREIDWSIVFAIATERIDDFVEFARCMTARLSND